MTPPFGKAVCLNCGWNYSGRNREVDQAVRAHLMGHEDQHLVASSDLRLRWARVMNDVLCGELTPNVWDGQDEPEPEPEPTRPKPPPPDSPYWQERGWAD